MRHLFIVDPLQRLLVEADTSIAFMRDAARRGHGVWTTQVEGLRVGEGGRPHAHAAETFVKDGDHRLSTPADIDRLLAVVEAMVRRAA